MRAGQPQPAAQELTSSVRPSTAPETALPFTVIVTLRHVPPPQGLAIPASRRAADESRRALTDGNTECGNTLQAKRYLRSGPSAKGRERHRRPLLFRLSAELLRFPPRAVARVRTAQRVHSWKKMAAAPRHRRPGLQGRRASSRPLVFILAEIPIGQDQRAPPTGGEKKLAANGPLRVIPANLPGSRFCHQHQRPPLRQASCSMGWEFQRPHTSQNQDTYITPPLTQPTPRHRFAVHREFQGGEAQRRSRAVSGFAEQPLGTSGEVEKRRRVYPSLRVRGSRLYRRTDHHSAIAANIDAGGNMRRGVGRASPRRRGRRISTRSGVSATSGMVRVTSATGMNARVKAGVSREVTASRNAKACRAPSPPP